MGKIDVPAGWWHTNGSLMVRFFPFFVSAIVLLSSGVSGLSYAQSTAEPKRERAVAPRLTWSAPGVCPVRSALVRRVEELLGSSLASLDAPVIDVAILELPRTGAGLAYQVKLKVELLSGTGERQFVGQTCEEAVEATALMLAFLLDPGAEPAGFGPSSRAFEPQNQAKVPEQKVDPERQIAVALLTRPVPQQRTKKKNTAKPREEPTASALLWDGLVGAYGVLDTGSIGVIAPGFGFEGGLTFNRRWMGGLAIAYFPTQKVVGEQQRAKFSLLAVSLRFCRQKRPTLLIVHLCAGLEGGRIQGTGLGDGSLIAARPWFSPFLGLDLGVPFGSWVPFLRINGVFPIYRHEFEVGGTLVHQAPLLVGRLEFGLQFHF